jgi:D-alanine-D-alanine ligase
VKKLRVVLLVHPDLIPPDKLEEGDPRLEQCRTEYDVRNALVKLGHEVRVLGVYDELTELRQLVREWQPHIAYNLLEEFAGQGTLDYYIVSYLDMHNIPYTGCNPRGLLLARDKALSKKILAYHRIKVPKFMVFRHGKTIRKNRASKLPYPVIIKTLTEQGSMGIAQASFVNNVDELEDRVIKLQEMTEDDVIAEQYIDGRELYVTVIGNTRLQVLPIRELVFGKIDEESPKMATYKVKWDEKYRERWQIDYDFASNLPDGMEQYIIRLCKRVYRLLDLNGYARLDLRLTPDNKVYVLEANPNAAIADNEDVAFSAEKAGLSYEELIQRLLNLGLSYHNKN